MRRESIEKIKALVDKKDFKSVEKIIFSLHPVAIARILQSMSQDKIFKIIKSVRLPQKIMYFLPYQICKNIISRTKKNKIELFIREMNIRCVLKIVEENKTLLKYIGKEYRIELRNRFKYHENEIGRFLRSMPIIPENSTIKEARQIILNSKIYSLYPVCCSNGIFKGSITIENILRDTDNIVYEKDIVTVYDTDEFGEIASRNYNAEILPVINKKNKFKGIVLTRDISDVISDEIEEDMFRLNLGNDKSDFYLSTMEAVWMRLRWIFITMISSLLTSGVISMFVETMTCYKSLPVVMSIVASMGGNTGAQTVTVIVRALATKDLHDENKISAIRRESIISGIIGAISGLVLGIVIAVWKQDIKLGIVLSASVMLSMFLSGFCATTVTTLLDKFEFDPALSASPIITTLTDTISYGIFLTLASLLLI